MPNCIYGETDPEMGIVSNLLTEANWPVRVGPGLARASATGGAQAWLCPGHPDMGIVSQDEYVGHLREGHGGNCISCDDPRVTPDDIMSWTLPEGDAGRFPVVVTWPDGTREEGEFLGGSTLMWHSLAQRCLACLEVGLEVFANFQAYDNVQARREELRRQVHPERNSQ